MYQAHQVSPLSPRAIFPIQRDGEGVSTKKINVFDGIPNSLVSCELQIIQYGGFIHPRYQYNPLYILYEKSPSKPREARGSMPA